MRSFLHKRENHQLEATAGGFLTETCASALACCQASQLGEEGIKAYFMRLNYLSFHFRDQ